MPAEAGRRTTPTAALAGLALALVAVGCTFTPAASPEGSTEPPTAPSAASETPADDSGTAAQVPSGRHVVAISVDGLTPAALRRLGPSGAPGLWRLLDEGASTLDARAAYEQTVTLPNHVGMVTGRPVDRAAGGHGVTFNDDVAGPTIPPDEDGAPIDSVLTTVSDAGGSTAVFSGKVKFQIFALTWPDAVDRSTIETDLPRLGRRAARDLATRQRPFTFVHLADPDLAGHRSGWGSRGYLRAVRDADTVVVRLLDTIESVDALRRTTTVVLSADHGGTGPGHGDATDPASYTVPFAVWGYDVPAGDLYELATGLTRPGPTRPAYDDPAEPVRNCDVAGVAARALALGPVAGASCLGSEAMVEILPRE